jgi:tripartite ATP-independent transporter DctP family solute receptor
MFRKFRAAILVTSALLLTGACAGIAHAQQARVLKLGHILGPESQLGAGAAAFAEEVSKRTGGRYKVDLYPNAALGGEVEAIKAVQLGTVDVTFVTGAPMLNFVPDVGVFGIPFLFRDAAHAHAVFDGAIGQEYLEKFRAKDMVALSWGENGMRHLTNSKRPVTAPEDVKGLKIRVPQSEVMVLGFKALGADVAQLPFPELYGALQSGQFDGQENPIATILSAKFAQVQKYLTLTSHSYDPAAFLIGIDAFEDLSDEDKAAFREAAKAGGQASRKAAAEAQANGVKTLQQQGLQVATDFDRAGFAKAAAAALPDFEKKFGAETIARIRNVQ